MTATCDEHIPGANVAWAACNGTSRSPGMKLGAGSASTATPSKPWENGQQLGFVTDHRSGSAGLAQQLSSSGLRRIAIQDVRVKLNNKLHHCDTGVGTGAGAQLLHKSTRQVGFTW